MSTTSENVTGRVSVITDKNRKVKRRKPYKSLARKSLTDNYNVDESKDRKKEENNKRKERKRNYKFFIYKKITQKNYSNDQTTTAVLNGLQYFI